MEMSVTVTFELRQAAAVRDALFRSTKEDSYEFPSQRTIEIREAIVLLDEEISKQVSETSKEDS
jgi:hypothetical protein